MIKDLIIDMPINNKNFKFYIFNYDYHKDNNIQNEGLDIISNCIRKKYCWYKLQTELLIEILKDGGHTFIDMGSHIGYYSLIASGYENNVLAIDKNKNYLNLLKKTVKDNNLENIKIVNTILDSATDKSLFENFENIKCLKVSLNGAEIGAINLFKNLLKKKKIEYIFLNFNKNKTGGIFFLKIMKKFGYNIFDLKYGNHNSFDENINHLNNIKDKNITEENLKLYFKNQKNNETSLLLSVKNK